MKKLLFITPELPFPAHSGGKLKSLRLLQAMAEQYEVTLACPLKLEDADHLDDFLEISPCVRHLHHAVAVPRTAGNLLRSYIHGIPLNVLRTQSRELCDQIAELPREFDAVLLDHYEVAQYLPEGFSGLCIYHAHNAYAMLWQRYAEAPGNLLLRAAAWLEARRVKRYEARLGNRAEIVFAAPNDMVILEQAGVDREKMRPTYHLGDDSQLALPKLAYEHTELKLMYVGFLGWEANVTGLLWFISEVWPLLLEQQPELRFDIVGKNPDPRLVSAVEPHGGIRLTGFVADLQTIYANSRVSVAPLLFGSGMKVKVLDAMARGIPTVTTQVGAEGIDAQPGTHLMVADQPKNMAAAIFSLLHDRDLWQQLQANSQSLIRESYTWRRLFDTMHAAINDALRSLRKDARQQGVDSPLKTPEVRAA